ncbi:hypothetical protein LTS15_006942 [Exophiala xenobiotica]|nr:hypothetical protein LTS15_006942 [Exophiala xenobiotica]
MATDWARSLDSSEDRVSALQMILQDFVKICKIFQAATPKENLDAREFWLALNTATVIGLSQVGTLQRNKNEHTQGLVGRILWCLNDIFDHAETTSSPSEANPSQPYEMLELVHTCLKNANAASDQHLLACLSVDRVMQPDERSRIRQDIEQWGDELDKLSQEDDPQLFPPTTTLKHPPDRVSDFMRFAYGELLRQHKKSCSTHHKHNTYVMLATYSELNAEDEEFYLDLLLSVDESEAIWEEVRVHSVRLEYVFLLFAHAHY